MKNKKVLLVNEGYSDNLGDQAIKLATEDLLSHFKLTSVFEDLTRTSSLPEPLIRGTPKYKKKRLRFISYFAWIFRNFRRVFKATVVDFDFAIIGGGQLILSNSYFPIAFFTWVFFLKLFNKKIVVFSVGVAERFNSLDHFLFSFALKMADSIFVRDLESQLKLINNFGISNVKIMPDVAYYLKERSVLNNKINSTKAIVGIVDYEVYARYVDELKIELLTEADYMYSWSNIISELSRHYEQVGLVYTTSTDYHQSQRFYDYLKENHIQGKIQLESIASLENFIEILKESDLIVSGRMHGLILGQVFNCKIRPWVISLKIHNFIDEFNKSNIHFNEEYSSRMSIEVLKSFQGLGLLND